MEKNNITENDIRATLSGGKNISKPKFIVLLILLCICFLGTLASGIMIIINSERIAEIVIYALIILAVLFLYMYPIYTVVNHKKKSGYGLPMPYYLTHIVIDRLTIPV